MGSGSRRELPLPAPGHRDDLWLLCGSRVALATVPSARGATNFWNIYGMNLAGFSAFFLLAARQNL